MDILCHNKCPNVDVTYEIYNITAEITLVCCECHKPIEIGEKFQLVIIEYEDIYRTCSKCEDLHSSLRELGYCTFHGELKNNHNGYINKIRRLK